MTATDELRRMLDERGVEYTSDNEHREFFWGVGESGVARASAIGTKGLVQMIVTGITPEQAIEATLGRETCRFVWSLADNGWADHTCSACGYVENTDVHVRLDWRYCPNCGRRVVDHDRD